MEVKLGATGWSGLRSHSLWYWTGLGSPAMRRMAWVMRDETRRRMRRRVILHGWAGFTGWLDFDGWRLPTRVRGSTGSP